ncbi:MAG: HD domain-containing protein [Armatimonadetes bacterium]|nr:HD domain-containing protein [Armatimonadota bacterium]
MRRSSKAFSLYSRAVSTIGVAIFIAACFSLLQGRVFSWEWLFFLAVIFVTELFPTKIPDSSIWVTVTVPVVLGMFLSHGLAATIAVSAVPILIASYITQWGPAFGWLTSLVIYNVANHIAAATIASLVYMIVGGPFLRIGSAQAAISLRLILFMLLWAAIYSLTTAIVCATGTSLYHKEPWRVSAHRNLRWSLPDLFVSVCFAAFFVLLYVNYGAVGILLLIIPFLVARQALNLHARYVSTYRETVTALGTYIQHHHMYTKGHLERVADLAERIARQMQLPTQSLMYIKDAGLLHDIGKVGVDETVLDKTGSLNEDDWAMIKQHPARGAEILTQMKYLDCIVPWVRGHHERPDGRGYPDGLTADRIPIEAAVIAAADAYDAMTGADESTTRVYRQPLTTDQALDQVRLGAGTQFDPRVVKAFLTVMDAKE